MFLRNKNGEILIFPSGESEIGTDTHATRNARTRCVLQKKINRIKVQHQYAVEKAERTTGERAAVAKTFFRLDQYTTELKLNELSGKLVFNAHIAEYQQAAIEDAEQSGIVLNFVKSPEQQAELIKRLLQ